jgi:hypothetical protein
VKHKKNMLIDLLGLQKLKSLLEQSQALVQENATQNKIDEVQQKVEAVVAEASAAIKKYIEEM